MTDDSRDTPVVLSTIYTRTGDDGTTGLTDFSRVPKTDSRLAAYADTDEANCASAPPSPSAPCPRTW